MIEASVYKPIELLKYPDLPSIDYSSTINSNDVIDQYLNLLNTNSEQDEPEDDIVQQLKEDDVIVNTKNKSNYQKVKDELDKQIDDPIKKKILLKIAEKESNFNPNAKNPKSSASGLFGFIDSTKQRFGYGKSIEEQIIGASKLYDSMYSQLSYYVNKYGTKNKSLGQLMYGMWFRPKSLLNYLKTGNDSYTDAQGTGLNKIFTKMGQKGTKINLQKYQQGGFIKMDQKGTKINLQKYQQGGFFNKWSDYYRKFNNSSAGDIYNGINAGLWAASFIPGLAPFTVPAATIMSGVSAASGLNDAINKKELTIDNGLDIAGAIPFTAITNKGMKPIMKIVGKGTQRVKYAPLFTFKDKHIPATIVARKIINQGGRRIVIESPQTLDLMKHRQSLLELSKQDKKYIPFTAFKFGMQGGNVGINVLPLVKNDYENMSNM